MTEQQPGFLADVEEEPSSLEMIITERRLMLQPRRFLGEESQDSQGNVVIEF